jgi:hypothetical protein
MLGFDEEVRGYVDDGAKARVSGRREAVRVGVCDVTAAAGNVVCLKKAKDIFITVKDLHFEA